MEKSKKSVLTCKFCEGSFFNNGEKDLEDDPICASCQFSREKSKCQKDLEDSKIQCQHCNYFEYSFCMSDVEGSWYCRRCLIENFKDRCVFSCACGTWDNESLSKKDHSNGVWLPCHICGQQIKLDPMRAIFINQAECKAFKFDDKYYDLCKEGNSCKICYPNTPYQKQKPLSDTWKKILNCQINSVDEIHFIIEKFECNFNLGMALKSILSVHSKESYESNIQTAIYHLKRELDKGYVEN